MVGRLTLAMSYVDLDAAPRTRGAAIAIRPPYETVSLVSALLNPSRDGSVKADPREGARMAQCVESFQRCDRGSSSGTDLPVRNAQHRRLDSHINRDDFEGTEASWL